VNRQWIHLERGESLAVDPGLLVAAVNLTVVDIGRRLPIPGCLASLAAGIMTYKLRDGLPSCWLFVLQLAPY